jgi:hypothetical protein
MLRYAIAASVALAMVSGVALAEPVGSTTVRQNDRGTAITKHFVNHRGEMVTKRKIIGVNGGVVRSRTVHDPMSGTVTHNGTGTWTKFIGFDTPRSVGPDGKPEAVAGLGGSGRRPPQHEDGHGNPSADPRLVQSRETAC